MGGGGGARRLAVGEVGLIRTIRSWTLLVVIILLQMTSEVIGGSVQEGSQEVETSGQVFTYNTPRASCSLCYPTRRHAPHPDQGDAGSGVPGCRCKLYKYVSDRRERRFYNVDRCTGVTQVPNFTLACTEEVLELSLSDNHLGSVGSHAFQGLTFVENERYLTELRLANTSLVDLHPGAFEGISGEVHVLDLGHNRLGTLPDAVYRLPALQRLLLNNNGLTLEGLQGSINRNAGKGNNGSAHLENVRIIDLSHNDLQGVPDLLPGGPDHSPSQLQELRLHGNPISLDLSAFVPLLARHRKLQKVTWPQRTVTCSCYIMVVLARNIDSDFNFPVIYPVEKEDAADDVMAAIFTEWDAVTCDRKSEAAFVDRPIGLLSDAEVRRVCWEWVKDNFLPPEEPLEEGGSVGAHPGGGAVTTGCAPSGYSVIDSQNSGHSATISTILLPLTQLGVLSLLVTVHLV